MARMEDIGNAYDYMPEIMDLCLNCKYRDCIGHNGCAERQEIINRVKQVEGLTAVRSDDVYEIDGQIKTLKDWCKDRGVNPKTVAGRLRRGMPWPQALYLARARGVHNGHQVTINGESHARSTWYKMLHTTQPHVKKYAKNLKSA